MAVNTLVALLFSLVFVVGVLVGIYVTCFSYSRAEAKAQRKERLYTAQRRTIERQRADSADWWKQPNDRDDRETWGEWKSGPQDFPR